MTEDENAATGGDATGGEATGGEATGGDARSVDRLRQQAKQLLKLVRAGDPVAIGKLRQHLPRLAAASDADIASEVKLADVQHAVARALGHESWAACKAFYGQLDPLHTQAARFLSVLMDGDVDGARRLLERFPAIARYSIHTAAAVADVDHITALLRRDPALASERLPRLELVPLMLAVQQDIKRALAVPIERQVAAVRALLEAGADPNASAPLPDVSDAIPALFFPCAANNVAVARLLLERGANPTDGESLYHAAERGHVETLDLLVAFGADVSHGPTAYGNTPLHFVASITLGNPIASQAMIGLRWLLAHGADPRVVSRGPYVGPSQHGETALHRAAAVGHAVDVLRDLVEHGAPVNAARDDGRTAYQLAMRTGHAAGAAFLASVGADTTLTATDTLLAACASGDEAAARAVVRDDPEVLHRLAPDERDALGLAMTRGDIATVRLMVALGWPLDQEGQWGGTPLHWAAWNGLVDMVGLLVEAGAPVNARDNRYGSSPIAWCAHGSRFCEQADDVRWPAIVHRLLDAGATRAESYNRWGEAPESMARPSVVQAMKARGFVP